MEKLYQDEKFKDITFKCSNGEVKAHKLILSTSGNSYFETLLSGNFPIPEIIHLEDVKSELFEELVHRIYAKTYYFKADGMSFAELIERYYFGKRFFCDDMSHEAYQGIKNIKLDTLSDEELEEFFNCVENDKHNYHINVNEISSEWLIDHVFGKFKDDKRFLTMLTHNHIDKKHITEILNHQDLTHNTFEVLFLLYWHFCNNLDIFNFFQRGFLEAVTAFKLIDCVHVHKHYSKRNYTRFKLNVESRIPLRLNFSMIISWDHDSNENRFLVRCFDPYVTKIEIYKSSWEDKLITDVPYEELFKKENAAKYKSYVVRAYF